MSRQSPPGGPFPPVPRKDLPQYQRTVNPTKAQLAAAEAKARTIKGGTRILVTQYAVWVEGAEYWVCPWDLSLSKNKDLYSHHYCRECGYAIAP